MSKEFIEKPFEEVEGGYYGDDGFYYTPDGSNHLFNKRFLGYRGLLLQQGRIRQAR